MVEVSLTVGKLDASLALLLTKDHHLIEFPTILLPNGVKAGSIVKIRCDRDLETELEEKKQFQAIQDEIINTFGKNLPKAPQLRVKNVTQTSCVLEWDDLDLGTASLKNLVLFRDGKKLGAIPSALTNKTTKLSGLPIDKTFKFHLRLDTTAGVYKSEEVEVTTHKMTDLSGITVCLGDITANDQFTVDDIQEALKNMGAHYPAQQSVKVDTTHYITTRENKQNPEFVKANEMNIPIIRPEWLKACERERRIVGVRDFYVKDCSLPEIFARNYWKNGAKLPDNLSTDQASGAPVVKVTAPSPDTQSQQELSKEGQSEEPLSEKVSEPAAEPAADGEASAPEPHTEKELPEVGGSQKEENPEPIANEEPAREVEEKVEAEAKSEEPAEVTNTESEAPTSPEEVYTSEVAPPSEETQQAEEAKEETKPAEEAPEEIKPAESLAEIDLNESNPESGVAEHENLPEELAQEEAKEAAPKSTEELTEINIDDDNEESAENDENGDQNDDAADGESAKAEGSGSKSKKKNKKKKKKN